MQLHCSVAFIGLMLEALLNLKAFVNLKAILIFKAVGEAGKLQHDASTVAVLGEF